jgi:hypothetical protein
LETFFLMEEKHAIRVQNFHEKPIFQDLHGRMSDMENVDHGPGVRRAADARRTPTAAAASP